MSYFYVFVGGGIGAVCRYAATTTIGARFGMFFPFGTLFVNIVGSFLIGLILGLLLPMAKSLHLLPESVRLMLTVGFLGGFTTFSSFSMETLTLLRNGNILLAFFNIGANVILGLLAAWLGWYLTTFLNK